MPHKPEQELPGQGALFSVNNGEIDTSPVVPDLPNDEPSTDPNRVQTVYGEEGSYVDVAERSIKLQAILKKFGMINSRGGFLGITDYDSKHPKKDQVKAPYGNNIDERRNRVKNNISQMQNEIRVEFFDVTGFKEMRKKELASRDEINTEAAKMWYEFEGMYSKPGDRPAKEALNRKLKKGDRARAKAKKLKS